MNFVLEMMNISLNVMNFALKMMKFVLKMKTRCTKIVHAGNNKSVLEHVVDIADKIQIMGTRFCIRDDGFCAENDGFHANYAKITTSARTRCSVRRCVFSIMLNPSVSRTNRS